MPYLLRFLLLAATPANVRRIISQIREQLKFTGMSQPCVSSQSKLKGKVPAYNAEGSILHALRSSLRFKNVSFFHYSCRRMFVIIWLHFVFFFVVALPRNYKGAE